MGQLRLQNLLMVTTKPPSSKIMPAAFSQPPFVSVSKFAPFPHHSPGLTKPRTLFLSPLLRPPSSLPCKINDSDMISQLELGKPEERRKKEKRVNGIFWILLLNLGIYVADHIFQVLNHFSPYFWECRLYRIKFNNRIWLWYVKRHLNFTFL